MKAKALCFWVIGIWIFVASPLYALNSEINRATLKGLRGVRVLVEDLAPEVEREGLVKDQLQKSVEGEAPVGRNQGPNPGRSRQGPWRTVSLCKHQYQFCQRRRGNMFL